MSRERPVRYHRRQKSYRLSDGCIEKLEELSEELGISHTAVIEISVREKFWRDMPRQPKKPPDEDNV